MNATKTNAASKYKADELNESNLPSIPEEEIQRYTIAEGLSETERIKELLSKKNETQQSYVFVNAVNIFKNDAEIQKQIIPLILKNLNGWNENIQTEAGNAFALLLKQQILTKEHFDGLREVCITMFKQWSRQILQAWIDVYSLLLRQLRESQDQNSFDKLETEVVQIINKMADKQSAISVRISATYFLKAITENQSFSSEQIFISKALSRLKSLCQDVNWEVRLGTSKILFTVSNYIGRENSIKFILPEVLEHVEDEESEVKVQGIIQYVKHLKNIYDQDYFSSSNCLKMVHTIFSNFTDPQATNEIKDMICKKLPRIIETLNNPSDKVLIQLTQDVLINSQNKEENKLNIAKSIKALSIAYSQENIFFPQFYAPILSNFLKDEIQGSNLQIKISIATNIHYIISNSFVNSIGDQDKNLQYKLDVLNLYSQLLKSNQKVILNELLLNADEVFQIFYNCKEQLEPSLHVEFQKIRKILLTQVEKQIQQNWRYHYNYFKFINKIMTIGTNDETSQEILPLLIKTLKGPSTAMPVRGYITYTLAEGIYSLPNATFRAATYELMVSEITNHISSQIRLIYLQFLEHLIPKISKQYFKSQFMEAYFKFKDEQIFQLLFQYVKIAPLVRMKLDDNRSIERLQQSLKAINNKFSTNKKATDLIQTVEDTLIKLKDNEFLDEVNFNIDFKDKELAQNETALQQLEKEIKAGQKKGDRMGLDRYSQKSGSSLGSSLGANGLFGKDMKGMKNSKLANSAQGLSLQKQIKSEPKNKLELPGQGKYKEESKAQLMPKKSPVSGPIPKASPSGGKVPKK